MKLYSLGPIKACSGRIHWIRLNFSLIKLSELSNPWLLFYYESSLLRDLHIKEVQKIIEKKSKQLVYIFLDLGQLSLTKKRNQLL